MAVATSGTSAWDAAECDILYDTGLDKPEDSVKLKTLTPPTWLTLLGTGNLVEKTFFYVKPRLQQGLLSLQPQSHGNVRVLERSSHEHLLEPQAEFRPKYLEVVPYDRDKAQNQIELNRRAKELMSYRPDNPTVPAPQRSRRSKIDTSVGVSHRDGTESRDGSRSKAADNPTVEAETSSPSESPGLNPNPFFTWTVRSSEDVINAAPRSKDPTPEAVTQNLFRILSKIDKSLGADEPNIGALYSKAYKCTRDTLMERHPHLKEKRPESIQAEVDGSLPTQTGGQASQHPSREGPSSSNMLDQAGALSKQLLETSATIIQAFLPGNGPSHDHVVCMRFWGTVDEILRVRDGGATFGFLQTQILRRQTLIIEYHSNSVGLLSISETHGRSEALTSRPSAQVAPIPTRHQPRRLITSTPFTSRNARSRIHRPVPLFQKKSHTTTLVTHTCTLSSA